MNRITAINLACFVVFASRTSRFASVFAGSGKWLRGTRLLCRPHRATNWAVGLCRRSRWRAFTQAGSLWVAPKRARFDVAVGVGG
jgi:hypothetical protein